MPNIQADEVFGNLWTLFSHLMTYNRCHQLRFVSLNTLASDPARGAPQTSYLDLEQEREWRGQKKGKGK